MIILTARHVIGAIHNWNTVHPEQPISDFTTRGKTSLFASKIFLSIQGGEVRLRQLNLLQRIIRCLFGFYSDTILTEDSKKLVTHLRVKEAADTVLNRVKTHAKKAKLAPEVFVSGDQAKKAAPTTPLETAKTEAPFRNFSQRIEEADTIDKLNAIKTEILKEKCSIADDINILKQKLDVLFALAQSKITAISAVHYRNDGLPDRLFDAAFDIIKYAKRDNKQEVRAAWKIFQASNESQNPDPASRRLNFSLVKEVLKLMEVDIDAIEKSMAIKPDRILPVGLALSEAIMTKAHLEMQSIQDELDCIVPLPADEQDWQKILTYYEIVVEKLATRVKMLDDSVRAEIQKDALNLTGQLGFKLLGLGADPDLVKLYLNPLNPETGLLNEKTRIERIFAHTTLKMDTLYQSIASTIRLRRDAHMTNIVETIRSTCQNKRNPGGGDCFFYSCMDRCRTLKPEFASYVSVTDWRALIVKELKENEAVYRPLIERRIQTDDHVKHLKSYEAYLEWIAKDRNWGSEPELYAISNLVKKPVIVIQELDGFEPTFSSGINLDLKSEPLCFINYNAAHYEAMVPRYLMESESDPESVSESEFE